MKMAREMELKRTAYKLYNESPIGRATTIIYFIAAIISIFIFWEYFGINIFLSILYGIITWFAITYVFDKILIKLLGVEKRLRKMNDEAIETSGRKLEGILGKSLDDI